MGKFKNAANSSGANPSGTKGTSRAADASTPTPVTGIVHNPSIPGSPGGGSVAGTPETQGKPLGGGK